MEYTLLMDLDPAARGRIEAALEAARKTLPRFLAFFASHPEMSERRGGYLYLANPHDGRPIVCVLLGAIPLGKTAEYQAFAIEKAIRLTGHPGQLSSWQSRNPDRKEWGGAVWTRHFVFSFSGFPELADEAFVLAIAEASGILTAADEWNALLIANTSSNHFFHAWRLAERTTP